METAECWQIALDHPSTPSALALTRQNLDAVRSEYSPDNLCALGAYELAPASGEAQVSVFATGSEVAVALEAREELEAEGISTRVVSVPCFELFAAQSARYRTSIIGSAPVRIAVEAGVCQGWERFIGEDGVFVGMHGFGASGKAEDLFRHFGITSQAVVKAARAKLK
jgi:transketolase